MNISSIAAAFRVLAGLGAVAAVSSGCYLLQSAQGHLQLMSKRKPISVVIDLPSTAPALRVQLQSVQAIRDFASRKLALPDNGSYRSYADVGRAYVVWNVVAAPEFSVTPKEWCYPIVGCVAYRGYFVQRKAERFAARQRARGFETAIDGAAAYSTLGHFDDPILNTMTGWDDIELASIVFHELTHQLLYVANDASFNEALATTVEEEGVRRWLMAQGREADLVEHGVQQRHYLQVVELLRTTREELRVLYASGGDAQTMRAHKTVVFAKLRAAFLVLKDSWGGRAPFSTWFKQELNNARLASIATYFTCVPGFERELAAVNGDLPAFYRRVRELAKLQQRERDATVCDSLG